MAPASIAIAGADRHCNRVAPAGKSCRRDAARTRDQPLARAGHAGHASCTCRACGA